MSDLTEELRAWAEDDIVPADLKELLVQAAAALEPVTLVVEVNNPVRVEPEPVTNWYAQLDQAKIGSKLVQQRGVGPYGPKTYVKGSYDLWYAEGGASLVGMPSYSFSQGAYALEERS